MLLSSSRVNEEKERSAKEFYFFTIIPCNEYIYSQLIFKLAGYTNIRSISNGVERNVFVNTICNIVYFIVPYQNLVYMHYLSMELNYGMHQNHIRVSYYKYLKQCNELPYNFLIYIVIFHYIYPNVFNDSFNLFPELKNRFFILILYKFSNLF